MKESDGLVTAVLVCEVYEGTAFVVQEFHTVDGPDPVGGEELLSI